MGKLGEAVAWYEKLINDTPRSGQVTTAYFNLGLVQRARMYQIEARKAFYRVVDRDPGHEIAPRALVQVGLTLLTEGHPLEAMIPLRQALALATTTPSRAEAVLALSAGCLLAGNPQETAKILAANRQCTNQDEGNSPRSFLRIRKWYRIALASKTPPRIR